MIPPQTLTIINTRNLHDCLDNAKFEAMSIGEQNIILELQIYVLRIDILILASNNQYDWRAVKLTLGKVLRKFISLSKQIELMLNSNALSDKNWLYEALEQTKKLTALIRETSVQFCDITVSQY
ncbi:hypothetical protein C4G90_RS14005 [Vibrio parahaemolyticus]|nr:hypothetical protein [Vibrio parahaemolyticus]EJG0700368.1 hypothetical protein [Vibrio parahaemolyticus]EJG0728908.1 hypothetical protein [Vibrio parahaemolyticus]EJG1046638.1 hypothetical protein [Vibrio parahaemolyticus]EJG1080120.1 hypothetical protein [Vibrio parahaemolyticus]